MNDGALHVPNEIELALSNLERAANENSVAPLMLHRHAQALFVLAQVLPASENALLDLANSARDESTWARPPYPTLSAIEATISYYEGVLGHGREFLPLDLVTATHVLGMEECRGEFAAQLLAYVKKFHGANRKVVEDYLRRTRGTNERVAEMFAPLLGDEMPPRGEDVQ